MDAIEFKKPYDIAGQDASGDERAASFAEVEESAWGDTRQDIIDMRRLGKKQEFNVWQYPRKLKEAIELIIFQRNFSFLSTLGFVSIYMATWEFVLVYVEHL
jgi:choline transport protein